ncbi:hypothetical protein INR49_009066, partial [Caranx melampygus]
MLYHRTPPPGGDSASSRTLSHRKKNTDFRSRPFEENKCDGGDRRRETNHDTGKLELYPLTRAARAQGRRLLTSLDVPFPSSREADIALRSLSPDREPRKGGISKELAVSGSTLSEVERRRSSNPPSVRELVSGSSVPRHGNHGDVWTSCFPVKLL